MKHLICLLFAVSSMAWSADKIFPYEYKVKDLSNGLRVIALPTDYPNIVSIQIPVQTGSRNEVEPGRSGFAHFFEHMMFRGTENYSAEAYGEILKNAGADQNAYTSDDLTNYHITFSKDDLETVLMLEADRFQNLQYSVEDFKTEARAVLGEYNKNFANPVQKLLEVQRNLAFDKHTYKHTTMGFIQDIENMPNMFDYSKVFFDRYYRPEYVTVIVAGDIEPENVFRMVKKYWGDWERGDYTVEIPVEPMQAAPKYEHIPWDSPTLPWLTIAFHGPAASETKVDKAAMDLIGQVSFSSSSPLYQKLVVKEQKVQSLFAYFPDALDPHLLTVGALLKDPNDMWYVRDEIVNELARLRNELAPAARLADIKSAFKYGFANSLDNTDAIASAFATYVSWNRDPETINRAYALYDQITPEIMRDMANTYFTDQRMVMNTLSSAPLPEIDNVLPSVDKAAKAMQSEPPKLETVLMPSQSPIINFRVMFMAGSANDPAGKKGLAALTAAMVSDASSQAMAYEDIQKTMYPMAAGFGASVDKEMTVFLGTTHKDNLAAYYDVMRGMLMAPAFTEDDFRRVKTNMINNIKVGLRGNNDEELGKEVLYEFIYGADHPYGALNMGHVDDLEGITIDDVRGFYQTHYNRANLVLGLAGDYGDAFLNRFKRDLGGLPEGTVSTVKLPETPTFDGMHVQIVKKETRATGISLGFPIDITRAHEDFAALWLIRSYFGEHRSTNAHLFQRIREVRGMNYGNYAYIEYFPNGMFQFHPDPNMGRRHQIFQIWIRPVVPDHGHFALRIAKYELDKLVDKGISKEDFEATRNYLAKFVNVLTSSQDRQLGYAMDSRYYGIPAFPQYIRDGLAKLTHEDVNRVLRKYLQNDNLKVAIITKDAEGLRNALVAGEPSPIQYDAAKPQDVMDEDAVIQKLNLKLSADRVEIVDLEKVFK